MTNLDRPVRRRTRDAYSVLRPKPEKIVVTLAPGDLLVFRKERGRRAWTLPIEAAFRAAVHREAARDAADKKLRRRRHHV
jgi:hypothetical protein